MVIRRVGPVSCAKVAGTLYALIGLVFGAIVSLLAVGGGMMMNRTGAGGMGAMFGAAAIVVLPILYGCLGFVGALVSAWLYNLAAGVIGGIELETDAAPARPAQL